MSDKFVATFAVWPYNGVSQERCGLREQTVMIKASDMSGAFAIAAVIVEAILTNPYVWVCKLTGLREAKSGAGQDRDHDHDHTLTRGNCDVVFAQDREEIHRADRSGYERGYAQADRNMLREYDALKVQIERLTFIVDTVRAGGALTVSAAEKLWRDRRQVSIVSSETQ